MAKAAVNCNNCGSLQLRDFENLFFFKIRNYLNFRGTFFINHFDCRSPGVAAVAV